MLALEGDHCGILSLLGTAVQASSPAGVMRKQYLLLSTKVHPDKHPEKTRHLATKAFQVTRLAYAHAGVRAGMQPTSMTHEVRRRRCW